MNFLAHCALGGSHPLYLVGGFLGDFIKGAVPAQLPQAIQVGVRLHRRIDAFSGIQADIRASVSRLPSTSRRLAPVFVDLAADHFLARHFEAAHGESLAKFSSRAYTILADHEAHFPATAIRFSRFMRDQDLFARYTNLDSVERAFARIAQRLGRESMVAESMAALQERYREFEGDFLRYYPELRTHAAQWLTADEQHRS